MTRLFGAVANLLCFSRPIIPLLSYGMDGHETKEERERERESQVCQIGKHGKQHSVYVCIHVCVCVCVCVWMYVYATMGRSQPFLINSHTHAERWASEMVLGCGINAWETNSQVVHTVSDSPLGPYHKVGDPVWPVFAHEPDVVRGPIGEWVMMYSAFPYTPAGFNHSACASCKNGTTPPQGTPGCPFQRGTPPSLGHNFKQMIAVAMAPDGPWREVEITQLTVSARR